MGFSQYRQVGDQNHTNMTQRRSQQTAGSVRGRVRAPRNIAIVQAVHRLDTEIDQSARADLAGWIREEYHRELGDIPLGFLAQCFLGPPFVDHCLNLLHSIVQHFAPVDVVPEPFAPARMLVRSGAYAFVEVYASGEIRPVLADGSVVA
jgi:hypothetical protein